MSATDEPKPRPVAVITGAGGGIGGGLAIHAAEEGMDVAICDRDAAGLAATADEVRRRGVTCVDAVFDIRDEAAVRDFASRVPGEIAVLIPNAGVLREARMADMTIESIKLTFDVNVIAVMETVHAFLPRMLAQPRRSRIVFIGSLASAWTPAQWAVYAASKQAVRAIADGFRAQLAEDGAPVDISLVTPGSVQTGIFREAFARDVAGDEFEIYEHVFERPVLTPAQAADIIFAGIAAGRYLIPTHPEIFETRAQSTHDQLLRDLRFE